MLSPTTATSGYQRLARKLSIPCDATKRSRLEHAAEPRRHAVDKRAEVDSLRGLESTIEDHFCFQISAKSRSHAPKEEPSRVSVRKESRHPPSRRCAFNSRIVWMHNCSHHGLSLSRVHLCFKIAQTYTGILRILFSVLNSTTDCSRSEINSRLSSNYLRIKRQIKGEGTLDETRSPTRRIEHRD